MRITPKWASDPVSKDKFDRNAVEIPRYASIEREASRSFQTIVSRLESGEISRPQAIAQFDRALRDHETHAFVAGRRARGDARHSITDSEANMLAGRHRRNLRYFTKFVNDVHRGRGRMPYARRAHLYAQSLWSLYTRGETTSWDAPEEENARFYWIMDPDAEHCPTCLERAKMSRERDGFSWEELVEIGFPGENTECIVNCRCHIRKVVKRQVTIDRVEQMRKEDYPDAGMRQFERLLGGEDLPIQLPAAGLPGVNVSRETLNDMLRRMAPERADAIGRRLPILPKMMQKPIDVLDRGDLRIFVGPDMRAHIERNSAGAWELALLEILEDALDADLKRYAPVGIGVSI